jgi:hypothetical protein
MSTEEVIPVGATTDEQPGNMPGSRLLQSIVAEVETRHEQASSEYNERYIDKGPAWGEHINYADGGHHGQTHRNKK